MPRQFKIEGCSDFGLLKSLPNIPTDVIMSPTIHDNGLRRSFSLVFDADMSEDRQAHMLTDQFWVVVAIH